MVESFKKRIAEASLLSQTLGPDDFKVLITTLVKECTEFEGIKKVEAFQKMQAQMNEIAKRVMAVDEILDLSFNFLDHPLT